MKQLSVLPPLNVLWFMKTYPQLSYLKPIHAAINSMDPYLFWNGETRATLLTHIASINFIISIVKPTRCTTVSNLFYFGMTLHVSDGLSVHHLEFKTVHTATGISQRDTAVCSLASRQQYLFGKCLLLYVQCHSKIKKKWYIGASSWFYCRNNITMHCPVNVKFINFFSNSVSTAG